MAVTIRTSDGERVVVQGTLAEVFSRVQGAWGALVDLKVEGKQDADVYINTQQITSMAERSAPRMTAM